MSNGAIAFFEIAFLAIVAIVILIYKEYSGWKDVEVGTAQDSCSHAHKSCDDCGAKL